LRLQRLGRVSNVSPSRNVIVKAENTPKLGSEVVDENLKVVGKVFDIVGPVTAPYAVIKPTINEPFKLLNKPLYLILSKTQRSKNK